MTVNLKHGYFMSKESEQPCLDLVTFLGHFTFELPKISSNYTPTTIQMRWISFAYSKIETTHVVADGSSYLTPNYQHSLFLQRAILVR